MTKSKNKLPKIKQTPLTKREKFQKTSSTFRKAPSRGKSKMPWRLKEDFIPEPKVIDCEVISFGCSNIPRKFKTITIKK